jgi:hypothetical protein
MDDDVLPEDAAKAANMARLEAGEMPLMCACGHVARTMRAGEYLCWDCFNQQAQDWWHSRPPQWWAERGLPVPDWDEEAEA